MCIVLVAIATIKLFREGSPVTNFALIAIGLAFAVASSWTPGLMIPIWKCWMKLGHYMEKVMTLVILGGMWLVTFLPLGLCFKFLGKSTLTLGFEPDSSTYWKDCDPASKDFALLERQY
jgi:hypothetical protein